DCDSKARYSPPLAGVDTDDSSSTHVDFFDQENVVAMFQEIPLQLKDPDWDKRVYYHYIRNTNQEYKDLVENIELRDCRDECLAEMIGERRARKLATAQPQNLANAEDPMAIAPNITVRDRRRGNNGLAVSGTASTADPLSSVGSDSKGQTFTSGASSSDTESTFAGLLPASPVDAIGNGPTLDQDEGGGDEGVFAEQPPFLSQQSKEPGNVGDEEQLPGRGLTSPVGIGENINAISEWLYSGTDSEEGGFVGEDEDGASDGDMSFDWTRDGFGYMEFRRLSRMPPGTAGEGPTPRTKTPSPHKHAVGAERPGLNAPALAPGHSPKPNPRPNQHQQFGYCDPHRSSGECDRT
ncbi:hypothetical protein EV182_006679, partial [Spiromyces aspiralis]